MPCKQFAANVNLLQLSRTPNHHILIFCCSPTGSRERRTKEFSGGPLKSPREVSTAVTTTQVVLNREGFTGQIMQWGQYIAHEFTQLGEEDRKLD